MATLAAWVPATAAADLQADTLPWLMSFNYSVHGAYVEVPLGEPAPDNAFRVWLELDRSRDPRIRLIQYVRGNPQAIRGCIGYKGYPHPCKLPPAQSAQGRAVDACLADIRSTNYFVAEIGQRVICLAALSDQIERDKEVAGIASLVGIAARWEWNRNPSDSYLNDLFPTAPFWKSVDIGIAVVGCQRVVDAVAAYSNRDWYKEVRGPTGYTSLTYPHLVWAWTYLVLPSVPIRCGSALYSVDHIRGQSAILPDQTALLRGTRSVVRIRIGDGSTDAPAAQVKRITPREYIERMLQAGQPDCVAITSEVCHWVGKVTTPTGRLNEVEYARRWFEGFDRDVHSIFLKK